MSERELIYIVFLFIPCNNKRKWVQYCFQRSTQLNSKTGRGSSPACAELNMQKKKWPKSNPLGGHTGQSLSGPRQARDPTYGANELQNCCLIRFVLLDIPLQTNQKNKTIYANGFCLPFVDVNGQTGFVRQSTPFVRESTTTKNARTPSLHLDIFVAIGV